MPIRIPNDLPATKTLTEENIFVMTETRAVTQDIRPLQIALVNLMPTKIDTETQLLRLLGNTSLQVETELIKMRSHESRNTSKEHLLAFYKTFDEIRDRKFDGMIITGAPVEKIPFEEVEYWDEEEVWNLTDEPDGVVTLYAVWEPISYTIRFDKNGGIGDEMADLEADYADLVERRSVRLQTDRI